MENLLKITNDLLNSFYQYLFTNSLISTLSLLFIFIGFIGFFYLIIKKTLTYSIKKIAKRFKWISILIKSNLLNYVTLLILGLTFYSFLTQRSPNQTLIIKIVLIYLIVILVLILETFIKKFEKFYQKTQIYKNHPTKSFFQVSRIILYSLATLYSIGTLMNQSPLTILSGIGALTAIIIFVFKDTILGFVASIQITTYDMLHINDWIKIPKYNINGKVLEITLNTIKIRNWDNTITCLPAYILISEPFKNYRFMQISKKRKMKKTISIDLQSIHPVTQKEKPSIPTTKPNIKNVLKKTSPINNLESFRKYILSYLKNHPKISKQSPIIIKYKTIDEKGLVLEIHAYITEVDWLLYETIQSSIIEHLITSMNSFNLKFFQNFFSKSIK